MDDIVRQAMAKWPNVPHCYGWLGLDARGSWRMRDEKAQALELSGDRINNPVLLDFIRRNYTHDDQGQWYFQNGPQRVYVDLEATPYIVRTDPAQGFVLHTGETLPDVEAVWMTGNGRLIFQAAQQVAMLDDRDLASCLAHLRLNDQSTDDEPLLSWLNTNGKRQESVLAWQRHGTALPVQFIAEDKLAEQFGFVSRPRQAG